MKSIWRLIGLTVLAAPVFAGLSPLPEGQPLLPGVAWGPVVDTILVMGGVAFLCGRAILANSLAVTALITVPVVFGGGLVSWLLAILDGVPPGTAGTLHGAHYIRLTLNMFGVIPLALAFVASIPFERLELGLLRRERGISTGEKYFLMFLRVFHHIVYFVIPNILEVMREEALLRRFSEITPGQTGLRRGQVWARRLTAGLVQVGVSGICAALRFIPLWAREIDDLPHRTSQRHRSQT
jgi:hypothetical protein